MVSYRAAFASAITDLVVEADADGRVLNVVFGSDDTVTGPVPEPCEPVIRQLREYFDQRRRSFDLVLAPSGTEFQQAVWQALQTIDCGDTISYAELARRIGKPTAVRAVGAANGRNPIPIIIPCHRVIGSDGSLTGFGGGLEVKRALLAHEGAGETQLALGIA